ncbi:MAG: formate dehydrogenase accessory sulfurtransferase FdhD [Flavobacteriales bacterium]
MPHQGERTYQALRLTPHNEQAVDDALVIEHPLRIVINGEPLTVTMQTPGHEKELVRGLLHSEDIWRQSHSAPEMTVVRNESHPIDEIHVKLPAEQLGAGYVNSRQLLSVASCGICGRTEFTPRTGQLAASGRPLTSSILKKAFKNFNEHQVLFHATGGCHGAAAIAHDGALLSIMEDIGRHNAVDKVIGDLINRSLLSGAKCMLVSGRISYELVAKCFMAGIPTIAAVSAPSTLAIDFAKELGVSVIAFCRDDRMTVYS